MDTAEKLIRMAEDELVEYSTEARKIEKLRRKFSFALPPGQRQAVRSHIAETTPRNIIAQLVERDRQLVALPFWGIGGLGLLIGISQQQPLDLIAPAVGFYLAFSIQKWGWTLEARRLALKALDEIESAIAAESPAENPSK